MSNKEIDLQIVKDQKTADDLKSIVTAREVAASPRGVELFKCDVLEDAMTLPTDETTELVAKGWKIGKPREMIADGKVQDLIKFDRHERTTT